MAGQINKEKFGRLPRFAKDLADFDVFSKEELMKVVEKEARKIHNPNPDKKKKEKKIINPEGAEKYRKERK